MMNKRSYLFLPWALLMALTQICLARHQVEVESTYLGDGRFRYQFRSVDDPFFAYFDLASLSVPTTNRVEYGPTPSGWIVTTNSGDSAAWQLEQPLFPGSQV